MALLSVRFALPLRHFRLELSVEIDRVVALVGPSGAGKSTVLSVISGLARPPSGRVALDDDVWLDTDATVCLPPDRRRVGLVFQEYALFPHMTVRQNVAYGARGPVEDLLRRLRIDRLAPARPDQLSGGERQRVALARALARDPGVLLLDEPLAALDAHTKTAVRGELADLLAELALPTLVVTHDYEDAIALADRVGVIVDGRLRQLGPIDELVTRPADAFVAAFTGANVLSGRVTGRHAGMTEVTLDGGAIIRSPDAAGGPVDVAVHPWRVSVTTLPPAGPTNAIRATLDSLAPIGGRMRARVGPLIAELAHDAAGGLAVGDMVHAWFDPHATRLIARAPRIGEDDHDG
ncbi:MAG: ABC transporter ATP-binding protein [Solirubrobacteraceae bacterium]